MSKVKKPFDISLPVKVPEHTKVGRKSIWRSAGQLYLKPRKAINSELAVGDCRLEFMVRYKKLRIVFGHDDQLHVFHDDQEAEVNLMLVKAKYFESALGLPIKLAGDHLYYPIRACRYMKGSVSAYCRLELGWFEAEVTAAIASSQKKKYKLNFERFEYGKHFDNFSAAAFTENHIYALWSSFCMRRVPIAAESPEAEKYEGKVKTKNYSNRFDPQHLTLLHDGIFLVTCRSRALVSHENGKAPAMFQAYRELCQLGEPLKLPQGTLGSDGTFGVSFIRATAIRQGSKSIVLACTLNSEIVFVGVSKDRLHFLKCQKLTDVKAAPGDLVARKCPNSFYLLCRNGEMFRLVVRL